MQIAGATYTPIPVKPPTDKLFFATVHSSSGRAVELAHGVRPYKFKEFVKGYGLKLRR